MSTQVEPVVQQSSTTLTQTTQPDWRSSLPEDIRGEESLKSFKDIPSLAKSFVETKKMVGSAIHVPKSDKQEEWDTFYSRLGRPETPDKYEFKRPTLPENVKYDEEMETSFKQMAHKAGLHPRQAQALLEGYNQTQASRLQNYTKSMEDGVASLKKEWGGNFDKQIGLATRAVKELGGDELTSMLEETGLGNHPTLIRLFAKLGDQMSEDVVITGENHTSPAGSVEAIQTKVNAIRSDKNHPFNNVRAPHALRETALKEMNILYEQLAKLQGEE